VPPDLKAHMSTQTFAGSESAQQLVILTLGREEYALPIRQVQEIIRYTAPRTVSSADPWVRGVISLRGKIVPVFDLGLRLGIHAEPSEDQKIVIVETSAGTAGVIVDEVEEVLTVGREQLDDVPGAASDAIDGIAKINDRLVVLLAPDRLLAGLTDALAA
jgi:purine-binding chemotaxis protein CheW